ncbi:serine/threonine-protein kinase [Nocardioides mangrovi]|uniref:non-specific serine/threonine protein kinase n=1 Tax=Nocardioides mangrovi TaxID=2874580 RepID=A0ABS7UHW1_9ACTN|nr:serine/threonine-protein kinase [Nocardioides mangrovi]MBZ5740256.1 serine/threonine protein kinase [Nocardioides mangrovi]
MPTSWDFPEGAPITAELTAVRRLGGGSAYEAWLAFDEVTYAPVVVKAVRPGRIHDERTLLDLAREAEALAAVNHPVVARGLRHVPGGDLPHLVLEQVDGPRLSSLVRRYGPLEEHQYVPLAIEVASALHYLRRIGWVHLDVKPSNVIMGAPARLIDLSVARRADDAARTRGIGTDAYMSPEQWDPDRYGAPSAASDVWGLGATLFEAVAGYRAVDLPTDEPAALPDGVPPEVAATLEACLAVRPEDRPAPREVAEALEPVLDRQPPVRLGGGLRTR